MSLHLYGETHTGIKRDHNEDSLWFDAGYGAAIVSDGMGGHAAGEVASAITVESFKKVIEARFRKASSHGEVVKLLSNSIGLANQELLIAIKESATQRGMGATAVCACLWEGTYTVANIGDSRTYMIKNGGISLLTKDDSLVQKFVDDGIINEEEARNHPQKNIITKYVGSKKTPQPSISTVKAEPGNRMLLCSDGLSGVLTDDEILRITAGALSIETACKDLIDATLNHGAPDNVTVVIFETQ